MASGVSQKGRRGLLGKLPIWDVYVPKGYACAVKGRICVIREVYVYECDGEGGYSSRDGPTTCVVSVVSVPT